MESEQPLATTAAQPPPAEESKESKWRKLQKKYLQYIQLLKKKIEHAQKKSSAEHTKMTSISQMSVKHDPRLVAVLCLKIQGYMLRQLCVGFHTIRAAAVVRTTTDLKLMDRESKQAERRQTEQKVLRLMTTMQRVVQCTYKHYFGKLKDQASPPSAKICGYAFGKLEQRIVNARAEAFYKILTRRSKQINPEEAVRCSLRSLKALLMFDNIVGEQIDLQSAVADIRRENLQLRAVNHDLAGRIRKLQLELTKEQEQRRLETDKKEKGLVELGEEMEEKEALIELLEGQLEAFRRNTNPDLLKKLDNQSELNELRLQVDKLSGQLERNQESSKQSVIKSRQMESELRKKINHLTAQLQKAQEGQYGVSYSRKQLEEERQNIHSLKKVINRQEAELRPREQRCSLIQTTFSRIHQQLAVSQMHTSEIIESEESARATLQRIITLLNDKRLLVGNALETSHHSRTNFDLLTMVEDMLDRSREFPYDQLMSFGGLCEDLYRLQQKISKLKKANTLVKQSVINGNDGAGTRRRKWVPPDPSDFQASNIPESDPGANISNRHNHSNPQLTTRLIELQMEKKKCEELVLELKQKSMMVRKIVHEFIRTLALSPKTLSKETDYTLGVVLEIFEYSEEEKDILFQPTKRRGFLGIF